MNHASFLRTGTFIALLLIALLPFGSIAQEPTTAPSTSTTPPPAAVATTATTAALSSTTIPTSPVGIHRVLIVSIDGLRPDVALRADMPNVRSLMARGSFSFWAQTTAVSITLPSHVSMLTGVTPLKHGISWNGEMPFKEPVYPAFPTIFELAHKAGYTTAMAAGKEKFDTLNRPGTIDQIFVSTLSVTTDADVATHAVQLIESGKPQVMFVHFPGADVAGHSRGWGGPEQMEAVAGIDVQFGRVLAAFSNAGVLDDTLIILSADHGGAGRNHGPDDVRSRNIPWIAAGPGVRQNYDLTLQSDLTIRTEDTFATACYVLGLEPAKNIDGKPVKGIFAQGELITPRSTKKPE